MIKFIESEIAGYATRTIKNIEQTNVTLAMAFDFSTAGEILTKKFSLLEKKNNYLPFSLKDFDKQDNIFKKLLLIADLIKKFQKLKLNDICLNVAGNGIYTCFDLAFYTQADIDKVVFFVLTKIIKDFNIISIRSGGQTGVDEAALKFAAKNGIEAICNFPQGWLFRDMHGNDIADRKLFLERFEGYY